MMRYLYVTGMMSVIWDGCSYLTSHFHMSDSFDNLTSSLVFFFVFCRRSLNEHILLKNPQYIFDSIQWNQINWELYMNFLVLANSYHCWSYHGLALSPPHGPDSDILDFLKNFNFFGDSFKFTSLHKSLKKLWLEHIHALHKFRENYQVIKMYEEYIDRLSSSKPLVSGRFVDKTKWHWMVFINIHSSIVKCIFWALFFLVA